jgi:hypothetical protein
MSDDLSANLPKGKRDEENAILQAMFAADVQAATETDNLPQYYVNSFTVTLGTGDVLIVMKRNGRPLASMQVSYTVAKSLIEVLNGLIARLENRTGNTIMTSKFIEQKMQESEDGPSS